MNEALSYHHIFLLNPTAGRKQAQMELIKKIRQAAEKNDVNYEIYRTNGESDARDYCAHWDLRMPARFYAIGGDGTLNEAVNGILERPGKSELALIPRGTGNDFARFFQAPDFFENIEKQMLRKAKAIDVIHTDLGLYGVNMINIGVDADTAVDVHRFSTFIPGTMAYILSLINRVLLHPLGSAMEICIDDGEVLTGEFLLVSFANGSYCGGGFKAAPKAEIDDGLLEICAVRPISKLKFAKLVGGYKNGTHLDDSRYQEILTYRRGKKIRVQTEQPLRVCIDGQILETTEITAELLPQRIPFVAPESLTS